jgi:hypothetical protein
MGTYGALSLLFCAAKRNGAFSPNMPAGLRVRVSRLGGFTRPFSGQLFPPGGARLFFIRAKRLPAVLARPQSWRGGGLHSVTISQKYWSSLVKLANTTSSAKVRTKRGVIVQAQTASSSTWRISPSSWNWFQKSQPAGAATLVPPHCLAGPTRGVSGGVF